MALGGEDQHGLGADGGHKVGEAGEVVAFEGIDRRQVDDAAAVFVAQCTEGCKQRVRRVGDADLVALKFEVGGKLGAGAGTVEIGGERDDFGAGHRGAAG